MTSLGEIAIRDHNELARTIQERMLTIAEQGRKIRELETEIERLRKQGICDRADATTVKQGWIDRCERLEARMTKSPWPGRRTVRAPDLTPVEMLQNLANHLLEECCVLGCGDESAALVVVDRRLGMQHPYCLTCASKILGRWARMNGGRS